MQDLIGRGKQRDNKKALLAMAMAVVAMAWVVHICLPGFKGKMTRAKP